MSTQFNDSYYDQQDDLGETNCDQYDEYFQHDETYDDETYDEDGQYDETYNVSYKDKKFSKLRKDEIDDELNKVKKNM